jgi:ribonuclease P protein component
LKEVFPKKFRILTREDFDSNKNKSSLYKSNYFLFFYNKNSKQNSRLGLKISKKAGNAVKRNYLKRVCRESFRKVNKDNCLDIIVVVNTRSYKQEISKHELYVDIQKGFNYLSKS